MVTAKHKFQRLVFNPANQKLIDFLDELQKIAKSAIGVAAQEIIEQFIYSKMPTHLKKSTNRAHLENGTNQQTVSHIERELGLKCLEAPDEMQINTMMQQAPQQNSDNRNQLATIAQKPGHHRSQCRQLKQETDQTRNNTNSADSTNNKNGSAQANSNPINKAANNTNANNTNNQRDGRSRPVFPPCETCGRTNHSTGKCFFGANAANRPPPRNRRPEGKKPSPTEKCSQQLRWECPSCNPNLKLTTLRFHSAPACDRPETNGISKLPPIPEVIWQQLTETITDQINLKKSNIDSTSKTTGAMQTSPLKRTQPQNYVVPTEHFSGKQTGNEPVPSLNCSKNRPTDIQNSEQHITTALNGDTTTPPLTTATPLIGEGLVGDEQTNEIYLPLTSTVVLKRKQEMLYVPLDFEILRTI